jgi:hypothetical protein
MSSIRTGRWTAELDGDFVVFLIGARISFRHPITSFRDIGGRRGMKYMLDWLVDHPEKGLLGYEFGFPVIVQYWRSFDDLESFARGADAPHLGPWRSFWKRVGTTGRTGIWHETFLVRDGEYECVYGNMPPRGLGKAGDLVPMAESSRARLRLRHGTAAPVAEADANTVADTDASIDD